MGRGCQFIVQKARLWTIVGNVLGEWHAPYTVKTSLIVHFQQKKVDQLQQLQKNKSFVPMHLSIISQWQPTAVDPLIPSFPHFYIVFI